MATTEHKRKSSRAYKSTLERFAPLLIVAVATLLTVGVMKSDMIVFGKKARAGTLQTQGRLPQVEAAVKFKAANHGAFPAGGDEVLVELTQPGLLNGKPEAPYLENPPVDDWGRQFHYRWPGHPAGQAHKIPAIWSDGPNGVNENGLGDDIRNW